MLPSFSKEPTPFRLLWTAPNGELVAACFNTAQDADDAAHRLLRAGFCPWAPADAVTLYDDEYNSVA